MDGNTITTSRTWTPLRSYRRRVICKNSANYRESWNVCCTELHYLDSALRGLFRHICHMNRCVNWNDNCEINSRRFVQKVINKTLRREINSRASWPPWKVATSNSIETLTRFRAVWLFPWLKKKKRDTRCVSSWVNSACTMPLNLSYKQISSLRYQKIWNVIKINLIRYK